MDAHGAMCATINTAQRNIEGGRRGSPGILPEASFGHLIEMLCRVNKAIAEGEPFSEGKVNRWLGYMQGVLVARGILTLDECKQINKDHAG